MKIISPIDMYLVDIELLDAQHQVILAYMNKVYGNLHAGKQGKDLFMLADRLEISCKLHFLDEEMVMEEMDFPEIVNHKEQHVLLASHIENLIVKFNELNAAKSIDELMLLKGLFLDHLEKFDRKYAKYKKNLDNVLFGAIQ